MSLCPHSLSDVHRACVEDDAGVLEVVLSTNPHLFHLPSLVPARSMASGSVQISLLDVAFENNAWRAAEVLLRCPGICPKGRKWPQEQLGFLCERMTRQPLEKAHRAIPLMATLVGLGAHALNTPSSGFSHPPLISLLWWVGEKEESSAEKMVLLHDFLINVDLSQKGPPLTGSLAHGFFHVMTGLGESTVVGLLGFNRFEGLLPAILDLLHARGWRDPEFLRWSTGMCPAVAAQWEADVLGAAIPEGAPVPAGSRVRI
jgi:hypothetical protein